MKGGKIIDVSILEKYIERIYSYALNNTYTNDEAQDLSQEILLTVVNELPYLRDEVDLNLGCSVLLET